MKKYVHYKVGKMSISIPRSKLHAARVNEREILTLLQLIADKHLEKEGANFVLNELCDRLDSMVLYHSFGKA